MIVFVQIVKNFYILTMGNPRQSFQFYKMGQRWHCKMEGEGAMCMKLYQPSELTTKDKNVLCSLTTELFNDVNSPRVLTFYGEHFSHFENFD